MPPKKTTKAPAPEAEVEEDAAEVSSEEDGRSREELIAELVKVEDTLEQCRRVSKGLADDKKALEQRVAELEELGVPVNGYTEDDLQAAREEAYNQALKDAVDNPAKITRAKYGDGPLRVKVLAKSVFVAPDDLDPPRPKGDGLKFFQNAEFAVKDADVLQRLGSKVEVVQ